MAEVAEVNQLFPLVNIGKALVKDSYYGSPTLAGMEMERDHGHTHDIGRMEQGRALGNVVGRMELAIQRDCEHTVAAGMMVLGKRHGYGHIVVVGTMAPEIQLASIADNLMVVVRANKPDIVLAQVVVQANALCIDLGSSLGVLATQPCDNCTAEQVVPGKLHVNVVAVHSVMEVQVSVRGYASHVVMELATLHGTAADNL